MPVAQGTLLNLRRAEDHPAFNREVSPVVVALTPVVVTVTPVVVAERRTTPHSIARCAASWPPSPVVVAATPVVVAVTPVVVAATPVVVYRWTSGRGTARDRCW